MTTLLTVLILIWPLILLLRLLMVARLVLGLEFRHETVSLEGEDTIPPHLREAARPWVVQLERLGFRTVGGLRIMRLGDPLFEQPILVLLHPEHPVRALIFPHNESSRSGECWLSLRTTSAGGEEIITSSYEPEPLVPSPAALKREVVPTVAVPGLLERHLQRVAQLGGNFWVCRGLDAAAAREQQICDAVLRRMLNSGMFVAHRGGALTYRFVEGFRRAYLVLRHASEQKKLRKAGGTPIETPALTEETLNAFDWQHYRELVAITRGRMSLRNKSVLTLVSLGVFAVALAMRSSPIAALTLLAALVVHEGGHLVGMWWFGFRDTQLLFIPFFGGAAVGHDHKVLKPWQHIVIILLGPLPGIFLGLTIVAFHASGAGPQWLQTAAVTTIVMNAFNLLPILPLDGGQIFDYAVAARFPRARVVFLTLSAAGMVLLGWFIGEAGFLLGVGAVMLVRTPLEWRLAGVRNEMRDEFPEGGDEESVVRRVLLRLREPDFAKVSSGTRLQLARALQNVLRTPVPGLGTICFALAGLTAPLWLALPVGVWTVVRGGERAIARAEAAAATAGVKLLTAPTHPSVAPEDNAGVLYAEAEALALQRGDDESGADDRVIALLRMAARKPAFVPVERPSSPSDEFRLASFRPRGWLAQQVAEASERRLRYGEKEEALAIAIDSLRLARLMDSAPGWWTWVTHERTANLGWTAVESALAAGAKPKPSVAAELRALADDRAEIAFASVAMPQLFLRQARPTPVGRARDVSSPVLRGLLALSNLSPDIVRLRTRAVQEAVVVHGHLQAIARGEWPQAVAEGEGGQAVALVARLGDMLARQREARAALAWTEHQRSASLDTLGLAAAELEHPFTHEPLRLVQRGAVRVIACSGAGKPELEDGSAGAALEWRLPAL